MYYNTWYLIFLYPVKHISLLNIAVLPYAIQVDFHQDPMSKNMLVIINSKYHGPG